MTQVLFDYTRQDASGASRTEQAWARVPLAPPPAQRLADKARAAALLEQCRSAGPVGLALGLRWCQRHAGPGLLGAARAAGVLARVVDKYLAHAGNGSRQRLF